MSGGGGGARPGGDDRSGPTLPPSGRPEGVESRGMQPRWAFLGLGVALFAVGALVWRPYPAGVWHDDGVYVLLGRALALGRGLHYLGVAGNPPAPKFPPLYPAVLSVVWRVFPELGRATAVADLLNLAFLAVGGALFARYLHRRMGAPTGWAVALAAAGWLPLSLWRTALIPFSEPLFLLLLVVALSAAAGLEKRPGDRGALVFFLGALLAACYVRTVGVVLAPAAAVALALRSRKKEAGLVLGVTAAGLAPWAVWSAWAGRRIAVPLRDVLGSYGPWLLRQVTAAPAAYLAALHVQALDLVRRCATLLLPGPPALEPFFRVFRWWALLILVPALLLGLDRLWSRSRTVVLTLFAYLGVIWIWPFRDDRLLVPVAPLLVIAVAEGFRWTGEGAVLPGESSVTGTAPSRWLVRAWRGVGIAWAALFVGVSSWGLAAGWAGAGYAIRSRALAEAARAVERSVPPGDVVGAPELWSGLHLQTGRTVVPSARFLPVRGDGRPWGSPAQQFRLWAEAGVNDLVLEDGGRVHGEALDSLTAACGARSVPVLARWQGAELVRLAWSAECRGKLLAKGGGDP